MITAETLKTCHMRQTAHYHGAGFFGYRYQCVEHPRLARNDRYDKKTRKVKSTFVVDGEERADLPAAIAALNVPVVLTEADRLALQHVPDEFEDIRRNEKPGSLAMFYLAEKGLIEWSAGKCRRTAAAKELLNGELK